VWLWHVELRHCRWHPMTVKVILKSTHVVKMSLINTVESNSSIKQLWQMPCFRAVITLAWHWSLPSFLVHFTSELIVYKCFYSNQPKTKKNDKQFITARWRVRATMKSCRPDFLIIHFWCDTVSLTANKIDWLLTELHTFVQFDIFWDCPDI